MKTIPRAILYHILLAAAGLAVGLGAGTVCALFARGLNVIAPYAFAHFSSQVWFLPLAGLFTAAMFRLFDNGRQGMGVVIRSARGEADGVALRAAAFQISGTWCAHFFCASVGREGAGVQIGAAIGCNIGKNLPLKGADRILLIAGMSAGFSALFLTPLAAFFFAMEVTLIGKLRFETVVPCLVSSFAAYFAARMSGLHAHTGALSVFPALGFALVLKIMAMGALFGLAALVFVFASRFFRAFFLHSVQNPFVRIFAAAVLLSCLLYLAHGGRYAGLGTDLVETATDGGKVYVYDWILKFLFTAATLGAGFIGGEVTTMFAAGATLGSVLAGVFGIPNELAVCLGYAAVFGACTRTLFAPIFLGAEIFGFAAVPYLIFACAASCLFGMGCSVYGEKGVFSALFPEKSQKHRAAFLAIKKRMRGLL